MFPQLLLLLVFRMTQTYMPVQFEDKMCQCLGEKEKGDSCSSTLQHFRILECESHRPVTLFLRCGYLCRFFSLCSTFLVTWSLLRVALVQALAFIFLLLVYFPVRPTDFPSIAATSVVEFSTIYQCSFISLLSGWCFYPRKWHSLYQSPV